MEAPTELAGAEGARLAFAELSLPAGLLSDALDEELDDEFGASEAELLFEA